MLHEELTESILGTAIEVHRALGPGLLETVYEACFCHELALRRLAFRRQVQLPVVYKGIRLDCGFRIDVVVEETVVVELKAERQLMPVHDAQILTYLKLSGIKVGLLLNFNVPVLKDGLRRFVF